MRALLTIAIGAFRKALAASGAAKGAPPALRILLRRFDSRTGSAGVGIGVAFCRVVVSHVGICRRALRSGDMRAVFLRMAFDLLRARLGARPRAWLRRTCDGGLRASRTTWALVACDHVH